METLGVGGAKDEDGDAPVPRLRPALNRAPRNSSGSPRGSPDSEMLERYAERLVTSDSIAAVLGG